VYKNRSALEKSELIQDIKLFAGKSKSYIGLVLIIILAAVFSPYRHGENIFLGLGNLTDILRQVSEKGILAVGMTLVILTAGIDLSVGRILAFGATLCAALLIKYDLGTFTAIFAVLFAGTSLGFINGVVTTKGRIQPFVVTLAMMSAAWGLARYISGGYAVGVAFGDGPGMAPQSFKFLGERITPYLPFPAILFIFIVVISEIMLKYTQFGRYIISIGGNEEASYLSGINIDRIKIAVYSISGFLSGLAGAIHCAQNEQGNPNDGVAYELDAIAAVVIGGTSLMGGTGNVVGTFAGILIIGVLNNIMNLRGINPDLQLILKGVIIVAAVLVQRKRK